MQKWASHETWLARLLFSELPKYFEENYFLPPWRQHDVVYAMSILEERGDLLVGEAGNATADAGYEEREIGTLLGELDKLIDIRTDGLYPALHRGDAIALTLQSYTLSHNSSKFAVGHIGCASAMHTLEVAAKHENLVRLQLGDAFWCCSFLFHTRLCYT